MSTGTDARADADKWFLFKFSGYRRIVLPTMSRQAFACHARAKTAVLGPT